MLYVSVDVEASGPVPALYNLVSIGAVPIFDKHGSFQHDPHDRFYVELKPQFDGFEDEAMAVHGIPREHLETEGLDPKQAMTDFRKWVLERAEGQERPPVFVGHNAAFDWAYVNYYFRHNGVENPFDIFSLDTKSLAFGRFGLAWHEARKSVFIRLFPDLPELDAELQHRADYDAVFQAQMFCEIMNRQPGVLKA